MTRSIVARPGAANAGLLRSETAVAVVVFFALALLPGVASGYVVYIVPQYLLYGMLAMSLALLWGFGGILSFGQAAFFALGAYAMGLAQHWDMAVNPAYVALLISIAVGGALAGVVGYFLFSAGVRDVYFVLVTLALSIMTEQITISQSDITGGYNGMFIPRMSLTFGDASLDLSDDVPMYYTILPLTIGIYALLRWVLASRFGKVLIGIRENEDRVLSLGFRTPLYKTAAFAISGAIAGLAGALYGTHASFVSPSLAGVLFSTQVVVWVAIGGRESLLGSLLGAVGVAALSNYLTAITPEYWQLVLGIVFVLVIMAFRGGVAGALGGLTAPRRPETESG
ncbi:MAG TPA: branched-chain amino acid ABC transporter permease [Acetobacteraceae bacterium]|nr:branched-chain amino acid ABC transporter permease [Acetobacteraceae bacterium]